MHNYFAVFRKYADFSGRSGRREYWMFLLISVLIGIVLQFLDNALAPGLSIGKPGVTSAGILSYFYGLALAVPFLSVSVRRLHDAGHRGSWLLLALVPVVGWIVLLYFLVQGSQPGDNKWS